MNKKQSLWLTIILLNLSTITFITEPFWVLIVFRVCILFSAVMFVYTGEGDL